MCGLVGAFRTKKSSWHKNTKEFMGQGLFVSTLRGSNGSGIGLAHEDGNTEIIKSHCDPFHFINSDNYAYAENNFYKSYALLGHTRAPTIANSVSAKNAQPFEYWNLADTESKYMMTHNGHVSNAQRFTPNTFTHQVDSAHVAYAFAAFGHEEMLPKLQGSYVLVWYHMKTRTINIAKNESRSLYIAPTKDKQCVYYMSEDKMLEMLLDRNWIEVEDILEVEPFHHYSWKLDEPVLEYEVKKYEEHKESPKNVVKAGTGAGSYPASPFTGVVVRKDDFVWVEVADTDKFCHYSLRQGGDSVYGYVYGTRKLNDGSVVRINSINKHEWLEKWSRIRDTIPVTLTKVVIEKDETNEEYYYMEGNFRFKEAEDEYKKRKDAGTLLPVEGAEVQEKKLPDLPKGAIEMVPGPIEGEFITKDEWLAKAEEGCYFCQTKPMESEIGSVKWTPWSRNPEDTEDEVEYQMICPSCSADSQILAAIL